MKDLEDNKEVLSSDLSSLAEILNTANLISDCSPIHNASKKVYHSNDNFWKYDCVNLKFNAIEEKYSGSIPLDLYSFEIIFSIDISGMYMNHEEIIDPLRSLLFNIDLEGYDESMDEIFSSLHLDRHSYTTTDNYVHPNYHFTYGGNNLEAKGEIFKGIIVLSTPRLPHPPLDLILGIDFILQNYYSKKKIGNILNNSEYKEIISRAQYRLWRPYYSSIFTKWQNSYPNYTCPEDFTHEKILPF